MINYKKKNLPSTLCSNKPKLFIQIVCLFICALPCSFSHAVDTNFLVPDIDGTVRSIAIQADQKIVVGGYLKSVGGEKKGHIIRLHPDGRIDESFKARINGYNFSVEKLSIMPNGQILVAGDLSYNGSDVVRLNVDGSVDPSFESKFDSRKITNLLQLPSKDLAVTGQFFDLDTQEPFSVARLKENGHYDASFSPAISGYKIVSIEALGMQQDGKLLVGGAFEFVDGIARKGLARFNVNGSLDTTFKPEGTHEVSDIVVQPDGKILVTQFYWLPNSARRAKVIRLNVDGSLDKSFNGPSPEYGIARATLVSLLPNGKMYVTIWENRQTLVRLNSDGSVDSAFTPLEIDGAIFASAIQADKKVVIGGEFNSFGQIEITGLTRLDHNGDIISGQTRKQPLVEPVQLSEQPLGWSLGTKYLISADSSYVVYSGEDSNKNESNLFSVAVGGGQSTKVHGDLAEDSRGIDRYFSISNTSQDIFYIAADTTDLSTAYGMSLKSLYKNNVNSGEITRVSGNHDSDIEVFILNETTSDVLYFGSSLSKNRNFNSSLYRVSHSNENAQPQLVEWQLEGNESRIVAPSNNDKLSITANGKTIVWNDHTNSIYIAPLLGGPVTDLATLHPKGTHFYQWHISPTGENIVYRVGEKNDEGCCKESVYSFKIRGKKTINLSDFLPQQHKAENTSIAITPNGGNVILSYTSPDLSNENNVLDTQFHLVALPINGGKSEILNKEFASSESQRHFLISKDSKTLIFPIGKSDDGDQSEAYKAPRLHLAKANIQSGSTTTTDVELEGKFHMEKISYSSQGDAIYFLSKTGQNPQIYKRSSDGSSTIKIVDNSNYDISDFTLTSNDEFLLFTARRAGIKGGESHLYSVKLNSQK